MVELEDLKKTDWLTGIGSYSKRPIITNVNSNIIYKEDGKKEGGLGIDNRVINTCNYKYLTIKPEALQLITVIHCPEEWMAEALCWAADRLGYRWSIEERYTSDNKWTEKKNETCYAIYEGLYDSYSFFKINNCKIIPFWEAVTGEENKENKMKYEWNTTELDLTDILNDICNKEYKKDFALFCFSMGSGAERRLETNSPSANILLKEIQKPEKEHWLKYAIENDYVKKVQTYKTVWVNLYYNPKTNSIFTRNIYFETEEEALKNIANVLYMKNLKTISLEIPED